MDCGHRPLLRHLPPVTKANHQRTAMLIVFGGLPGTGKTAVSRRLAERTGATYLRIDAIEQALRSACGLGDDVGPAGYEAAYALARSNLRPGHIVVADCVNPLPVTRRAWRDVAAAAGADIVEIELICSDPAEHRRRVEGRIIDLEGLKRPSWADVEARDYEPWTEPRIVIDTAFVGESEAAALAEAAVLARNGE